MNEITPQMIKDAKQAVEEIQFYIEEVHSS